MEFMYFASGKEIHYQVLCAVFWGFRTIRARDFQDYWKMKSYLRRMLVVKSINCVVNLCSCVDFVIGFLVWLWTH